MRIILFGKKRSNKTRQGFHAIHPHKLHIIKVRDSMLVYGSSEGVMIANDKQDLAIILNTGN